MTRREEIRDGILKGCAVVAALSFGGVCIHDKAIVDEKRKTEYELQRKAEKQEEERQCLVYKEAALFTDWGDGDCSRTVMPISYDTFVERAYFRRNDFSLDQEPAWLTRGDEIGKKIDPEKDFTRQLCIYSAMRMDEQTFFGSSESSIDNISFLERCEMAYHSGINAAAHAYDLLIRGAKYCALNELPQIGHDMCYHRATHYLKDYVRPLAKRTGYVNFMDWQMDEQRLEDASRPATK